MSTSAPLPPSFTPSAADAEAPPARNCVRELRASGAEPRGFAQSERSEDARSPGLVYTVTSHPNTPDEWAAWDLTRRLLKMRRRTLTRSRVQAEEVPTWPVHLITTTYRPGVEWSPRHIAACMHGYRQQARRDGVELRYEWVAELQLKRMRRGDSARQCMHYHALVWQPPGYEFPFPDQVGWWPHGMTNVERARNPVGYIAKYASKGTEGEPLPRGARISGGGGISLPGRLEVAWWMRPRYVREAFPVRSDVVRRMRGGGWVNITSGEFLSAEGRRWQT